MKIVPRITWMNAEAKDLIMESIDKNKIEIPNNKLQNSNNPQHIHVQIVKTLPNLAGVYGGKFFRIQSLALIGDLVLGF